MNSIKVRTNIGGFEGWSLFETKGHISWDAERRNRDVFSVVDSNYFFTYDGSEDIFTKEIRYKNEKDEWKYIIFHNVAYIINEYGKTIETINVN